MIQVPMDQANRGNTSERENNVSDEKDVNKKVEEDQDTEGHSVFATFDYYSQRNRDRQSEVERESRQREQVREAREAKKNRR